MLARCFERQGRSGVAILMATFVAVLAGSLVPARTLPAAPGAGVPFSSSIPSVDAGGFPSIVARAVVFSRSPLPELSRDDFVLSEDGTAVADFTVVVDREPFYVGLVLDRSGSMEGAMGQLKRAAWDFVKLLDGRAYCQLTTFATDVRKLTGFCNDAAAFRHHIAEMTAFGATAFYDAVGEAVDALGSCPESARRVVVAFTDGRDQNAEGTIRLSRLTARDLVTKAKAAGVQLYLIGLGSEVDRKHLQQLAALTGGTFLFSADEKGLAGIFERVARMVEVAYRVGYTTPRPARDGTVRTLVVASRLSGTDDQGTAEYRAPSDPAPPTPAARPSEAAASSRADGRFLIDPALFVKEDLDAELLVPTLIEDESVKLADDEPAKAGISATIADTNARLQAAYDRANRALGPVLVACARAIARDDFPALRAEADRGRLILRAAEDEVLPLLKEYAAKVAVFKDSVGDRGFRNLFNLRVVNTDRPRIALLGQCQSLHQELFRVDEHDNTVRKLIEAFNAMVGRINAMGAGTLSGR